MSKAGSAIRTESIIAELYDVAVDPERLENLLDVWEAEIGPYRNDVAAPFRHLELEQHFDRADIFLDRYTEEPASITADILTNYAPYSAVAIDPALTIFASNVCFDELNARETKTLRELTFLEPKDLDELIAATAALFRSAPDAPELLRFNARETDAFITVKARHVAPRRGSPLVILVFSKIAWRMDLVENIARLARLTRSETRVLKHLLELRSRKEISEIEGKSDETIKSQTRAVLQKMCAKNKSDLFFLALPFAKDRDDPAAPAAEPATQLAAARRSVLRGGRRLEYFVFGAPDGRPCLYLHGPYGLALWPQRVVAEATRRGLRVIAPVRAGFGGSSPIPRGEDLAAEVSADLAQVAEHAGCARFPLITLRNDAFFAFEFSLRRPDMISAIVACGGVAPMRRPEQYKRMHKWQRFMMMNARYAPKFAPFIAKSGFYLARRVGKRGFLKTIYKTSPADLRAIAEEDVFAAMAQGSSIALDTGVSAHEAFAREMVAFASADWRDAVLAAQDRTPVLFVNGLQDPMVPKETLLDFQAEYPWIEFMVFKDAGQLVFFTKWRHVLERVDRYAV